MRAILLAAGEGSRLRPLTATRPKPMLQVGGRPILQYVVDALVANGITDLTLVVGYHRAKIQTHFEDGHAFGARIRYVTQPAPLGTAHALNMVDFDEDVLVLGGDNVVGANLVKALLGTEEGYAMATARSENPSRYGVVTREGDRVTHIEEKPPQEGLALVNTGVYRFPATFRPLLSHLVGDEGVTSLTDVLNHVIDEGGAVRPVMAADDWLDPVHPWDLLDLNAYLLRGVHERAGDADVARTAEVEAPVWMGKRGRIGSGAVVRSSTAIGEDVSIGPNSVIENCIIGDGATIGAASVLRNTIVAPGARLGPRTTCISGPCMARTVHGVHDLEDFGCVIGEDARLQGANTVLPGALVGNAVEVQAGATVRGNVPDHGQVMG